MSAEDAPLGVKDTMSDTTNNRTLLEKADLALADISGPNGALQEAQAAQFVKLLIKESKVMQMATVTPLKAPKQLINKVRFNSRVLKAGVESTALVEADRSKPDFTHIEHDAQLFRAEVRISTETLEDNIEGDGLRNTIMSLMADAISRDMDEIAINGDTTSADPALASFDGLLKLAQSNVVNAGGATLNKSILRDMLKTMPQEFRRDKGRFRFLTSANAEIDYRDTLADRMTIDGDRALASMGGSESAPVGYSGIRVDDIPMFPENLGGGQDETNALLCDPKNIDFGIWRKITVETDKDITKGVLIIVATLRFDAIFQEETAVVKAEHILVG